MKEFQRLKYKGEMEALLKEPMALLTDYGIALRELNTIETALGGFKKVVTIHDVLMCKREWLLAIPGVSEVTVDHLIKVLKGMGFKNERV